MSFHLAWFCIAQGNSEIGGGHLADLSESLLMVARSVDEMNKKAG
jgi:hypothetical protein